MPKGGGHTFNVSGAGNTASTSLGGQFAITDNPLSPLSQFGVDFHGC
jgi:hypothetical protein